MCEPGEESGGDCLAVGVLEEVRSRERVERVFLEPREEVFGDGVRGEHAADDLLLGHHRVRVC